MSEAGSREPLRVAVVGAGYFARYHLRAWQRIPGASLAAVCDVDRARLATVADDCPHAARFDDLAHMLDAVRPDLVDIVTPPPSHLELVRTAAACGAFVVCQKPLAPTLDDARAVVAAARSAGVGLAVHENIRFTPWHREIGRLLRAGTLGRLHNITMRLRPGDGQGRDAYLARQPYFQRMPRFLVHETAIHWIDTFRYLGGEVRAVLAWLRRLNRFIAGEDAGHVLLALDGDVSALFDGNRLNGHPSDDPRRTMGEMWVECEGGVIRLAGSGRLYLQPHGGEEREHPYAFADREFAGDCVHALQSHLVAHLRDGAPLENAGADYLRNIEVEEAVYRSAAEGRWVRLDD
ncbi:MAG: Gfo/Idh/MocA family oxidoreductase [Ectothiorhodospiraceae bacterium]|nr:Gfo/Idh/MocA family oxidoreductase [Chromatiales bacterium]MCP5155487.1 Gfo/Idh/MocA family oxidoreductase [Ectothiorhodospiraceae bacterium]